VDEEAVNHAVEAVGDRHVIAHELIGYAGAEPAAPCVSVEAQQMLAVDVGLGGPELSDPAAFGKDVAHQDLLFRWGRALASSLLQHHRLELDREVILRCSKNVTSA